MTFRGTFKVKNLNAGDKVTVGSSHNNVSTPPSHPSGPAQYLIIDNIEYLISKPGSRHKFFGEPSWNGFNNKVVDVDGTFIGATIITSSIVKV